ETESVIQGRIDDIWKIKQSLDKRLAENASGSSSGVELPPIIVNAPGQSSAAEAAAPAAVATGKTQGSIISINEPNNFVIVDLGQDNSPVAIGSTLKAYRGSSEIATLQVIQIRRDICAADIKTRSADLRVGDMVKLVS
ncbi:MAG: hypothetical protein KGJ09_10360, partial [Candidatus Omnitrophica bacterium]|nr:hypothetical protein [Candidatus Omnitrophota bacterium]